MTPTDEELNLAAAILCGYSYCHHCQSGPDEPCTITVPDYCMFEFNIPELLATIPEEFEPWVRYQNHLEELVNRHDGFLWKHCHTAPPKMKVIAALKTMGAWKEEWDG